MASNPQSVIPNRALDQLVRRVDEDRWLASRFAPHAVRARLVALYAVNHEIARTGELVSDPGVGAVRLAWWRDAVSQALDGASSPREHPAIAGFAAAARGAPWRAESFAALFEARAADLQSAPFGSIEQMEVYVGATAGAVMRLAVEACDVACDGAVEDFVRAGALAWGLTGLMRAEPHWRARGRTMLAGQDCPHSEIIARARSAHAEARQLALKQRTLNSPRFDGGRRANLRSDVLGLPSTAFPAIGYVALAPGYLRALERGDGRPPLLARQIRLIGAAATGRL